MSSLTIGELARLGGTKVTTIRWYEQAGLLPAPLRSSGNQRRYGGAHLARLRFIRRGRELGFSLDSIRDLLSLAGRREAPCAEADRIASAHLRDVREKIARLESLGRELERMLDCRHGKVAQCHVIEALASPDTAESGSRPPSAA
ncbi:MAG: helix-turn-helix domain-containing protein [Alphaproteobacteria bacterium]|nr:helix-turn-helix domain-containing protein [Alphaproteobacteria bacterium]